MDISPQASSPLYQTYARMDLPFDHGEGAWLVAEDGRRYLDFMGGVAVNILGHAHPHLVEAVSRQAAKLWHVSNIFEIPGQIRLGERLAVATFADKVFFSNSGAEAVECAIKTARRYHYANGASERTEIITFEGAFHGRTLAAIAAGGQEKYLEGFGPRTPGFIHIPAHDPKALEAAIGPATAGILIEPVQGEGGIRVIAPEFLRQIRTLCDDKGLVMMLDEIQCGMGRTGKLFAYEWAGVEPDIMAIAKGIGGGFPLGACLATDKVAAAMTVGTHGSTFGGNPLAMAVGNAVLDVVLEEGFLDQVARSGLALKQKLAGLVDRHAGLLKDVRGMGLMLGLECKVPNVDLMAAAAREGLLTVGAGDNVLRLLPPLTIGEEEIDAAVAALDRALSQLPAPDSAK